MLEETFTQSPITNIQGDVFRLNAAPLRKDPSSGLLQRNSQRIEYLQAQGPVNDYGGNFYANKLPSVGRDWKTTTDIPQETTSKKYSSSIEELCKGIPEKYQEEILNIRYELWKIMNPQEKNKFNERVINEKHLISSKSNIDMKHNNSIIPSARNLTKYDTPTHEMEHEEILSNCVDVVQHINNKEIKSDFIVNMANNRNGRFEEPMSTNAGGQCLLGLANENTAKSYKASIPYHRSISLNTILTVPPLAQMTRTIISNGASSNGLKKESQEDNEIIKYNGQQNGLSPKNSTGATEVNETQKKRLKTRSKNYDIHKRYRENMKIKKKNLDDKLEKLVLRNIKLKKLEEQLRSTWDELISRNVKNLKKDINWKKIFTL